MDFEELQKSWKSQPVSVPQDIAAINDILLGRWRKQQRGVLWSNIFTTIGFLGVITMFFKIHHSFHEGRSLMFSGSLLFMTLLMLVYLWVIWKGVALKKMDLSAPTDRYLAGYLKTLHWRRKLITTYSWIYAVLLWLSLMLYMIDVLHGATLLVQIGAFGGTTLYIFGVMTRSRMVSGKKQLQKIDELVADINVVREKISG